MREERELTPTQKTPILGKEESALLSKKTPERCREGKAGPDMAILTPPTGAVRVARQVLSTIVMHSALNIPGVVRIAQSSDPWTRLFGRDLPAQGVALTIEGEALSADLYLVVESGVNIMEVGVAVQQEVASAIELMIGMQVQEVNVYIQDVT